MVVMTVGRPDASLRKPRILATAPALDGAHNAEATAHAFEPVIRRPWLTPGTHVTSVGRNRVGHAAVTNVLFVADRPLCG
ncbi:hypothetical protein [Streptomyces sp. NPDC053069]|uniref:hypothetical protein n=1 Tax=Streptomyces sp. NPDC053069 TaxID=3365695 RepID=UPI0037CE4E84